MKHLKGGKIWWGALPLAMVLFVVLALSFLSGSAAAANGTYRYTNGNKSIVGPDPNDTSRNLTYSKSGVDLKKYPTGVYFSGDGSLGPNDNLCPEVFIFTNDHKDGSSKADIKTDCGSDATGISKDYGSITITGTQAPQTGTWIDHSHISSGGNTYYDAKEDNNLSFKIQNSSDSCTSQNYIDGFPNSDGAASQNATATATIHLFNTPGGGNNTCVETDDPIKMSGQVNFDYWFAWSDGGTISTSDQTAIIFTQKTTSDPFLASSGRSYSSTCQSSITGATGWPNYGTLIIRNDSSSNPLSSGFPPNVSGATLSSDGKGCFASGGIVIQLADPKGADGKLASDEPVGSGSLGGGNTTPPSLDCNVSILNPLTWLICPIEKGMAGIVSGLDVQINNMLAVGTPSTSTDQPTQIFCDGAQTGTCGDYFGAWEEFRNIALGLMAIAGLIIVISQALGMEILDAYTIRKMLPRLLIAALAITLSWQLMRFAVTLTNDLGYGMKQLIDTPFNGIQGSFDLGGGNGLGTSIVGSIALTSLGIFGLLSFVGTAAIAVFIAFLTLIIRQLVIVMLIIVSPIAIVAYILPNTQKTYKLWWESFSKALLMFPLIIAFIEIGRVFAVLELQPNAAGTGGFLGGTVQQFVGFFAYFAPYFMIPATFRFAGAAMGGIGSAINSRGEGARNALKGYRGNVAKKNWQDLKDGNRLKGENIRGYGAFARRFNAGSNILANASEAGYNPRQMKNRMSAFRSTQKATAAKESLERNEAVKNIASDDDLVEAALFAAVEKKEGRTGGDTAVRAELQRRGYHNVDQGVALVRRAERSMDTESFESAMAIASFGTSSGWTPKYETDPVTGVRTMVHPGGLGVGGATGAGGAREMINRIAGGDRQRAIMMLGAARQQAESKGRYDLSGGSFTEDAEMLDQMHTGRLSSDRVTRRVARGVLEGTGRGRVFGGHKRAIDALAPEVKSLLDESFGLAPGEQPATAEAAIQQLAFAADSHDYASSNSPESARVFNEQVLSQQVDIGALSPEIKAAIAPALRRRLPDGTTGTIEEGTMSYGTIMEAMRTDPSFGRYRREYGRGGEGEFAEGERHTRPPDPTGP
jgi:hypothetical protein